MANTLREILVRISADATGLDRGLTTALGKTKRFGAEMASIGQSATIGFTVPMTLMGGAALKASSDLDTLTRGLTATMKSSAAAAVEFTKLQQVAKLPGIGLEEAVRGSIRLQQLGNSADFSRRLMTELGNAIAVVGGGKADFSEVIRQLSQMAAVGKVTKENLDPIVERIPQIAAIIKDKFGPEALGDPAKTFEKMGISAQQFIDIIINELGKGERATGGIKNAWENFQDSVTRGLGAIGQATVTNFTLDKRLDEAAAIIERAGKVFSGFSSSTQTTIIAVGGLAAAIPPLILVTGTLIEKSATVISFFRNWAFVGTALAAALHPVSLAVGFLVLNIGKAVDAYQRLKSEWENDTFLLRLRDRWKEMEDGVKGLTNALGPTVPAFALLKGATSAGVAAIEKHTKGTKDNADAIAQSAAAYEAWGGPIRRTTADFEAQLDALDRLRAAQRAVADAQRADIFAGGENAPELGSAEREASAAKELERLKNTRIGQEELNDALKRGAEQYPKIEKATQQAGRVQKTVWQEVDREVRRAFDSMARSMARTIVEWKGFGDTLKNIAQDFASGILEVFIQRLFDPLQQKLGGILGGLGNKPGIINNAVGGGSSAGGAIGSVGGSAGGAGGAVASAGLNAVLGTVFAGVGAAAGIGNLIVGIRQEGTMNQIERNTAAASIHLQHILENSNRYWPPIEQINGFLWGTFQPALASLMSTVEDIRNGGGNGRGGNQTIQLVVDGKVLAQVVAAALPRYSPAFG